MSLLFNGTTDVVTGPSVTAGSLITYFAWIRPSGLGEGGFGRVASHGATERSALFLTTATKLRFLSGRATPGNWDLTNNDLAFNAWQSVGATYDGTVVGNVPVLYVNGTARAISVFAAPSGAQLADGGAIYAGNRNGTDRTFAGEIAEWAMWFRALTAFEHSLIHQFGPLAASGMPAVYWKMDGSVANALDRSGNARNGTLTGTTLSTTPPVSFRPSIWAVASQTAPASQTVAPTGLGSAEVLGTPTLTISAAPQTIQPLGIASAQGLGVPGFLILGGFDPVMTPTGMIDARTFWQEETRVLFLQGTVVFPIPVSLPTISLTGIVSAQGLGTPTIVRGPRTVGLTGTPSAQAIGLPTIATPPPAPKTLTMTGVASGQALGVPNVIAVPPAGAGWSVLLGSAAVSGGAAVVSSGPALVRANVDHGTVNHWAEVSVLLPGNPNGPAVCLSASGVSGYVGYQDTGLRWVLGRYDAGTLTVLASQLGAPAVQAGDRVKLVFANGFLALWHGHRLVVLLEEPVPLTGTRTGFYGLTGSRTGQFRAGPGDGAGAWRRGLIRAPTVRIATRDPYYGVLEPDEISFELENDGTWTRSGVFALRGRTVTVDAWDGLDRAATRVETFSGVISASAMGASVIAITAASLNRADLEAMLPRGAITAAEFPMAVDVGKMPAVPFGLAPKVPLVYVHRDLTTNTYRYVCRRTPTVVNVWRGVPDGLFPVGTSEYTVSYTTYPGYTTLIFPVEQIDMSGANHQMYADLAFTAPIERNFARVLRYWLNDPVWGLGRPYNAAAFADAEEALEEYGGLYCDGHAQEPRAASEYLRMLMMVRGIRIWINAFGEYDISVDTGTDVVAAVLGGELGDGPRGILGAGDMTGADLMNATSRVTLAYRRDASKSEGTPFTMSIARVGLDLDGQDLPEDNVFIDEHGTADRVADFRATLAVEADQRCQFTLDPDEGQRLRPRDLIMVTYPPLQLFGQRLRIASVDLGLDVARVVAHRTSPRIYSYTPGPFPADAPLHGFDDYSRVIPSAPTAPAVIGTGTEPGTDGSIVGYQILSWTPPPANTTGGRAYYAARIDFTLQGQSTYHTAYATVPLPATTVKVSGLVTGRTYNYLIVSVSRLGVAGGVAILNGQVAPGDTGSPAAPGAAPTIQAQHLREFTFAVPTGTEDDIAELEWDVRTAASGGGTLVMTGSGPIVKGGTSTFKVTLPASVPYGSTRHARVRFKDTTGNPTSPTAGWSASRSFSAARNQSDDYEDRSITYPKREYWGSAAFPYFDLPAFNTPGFGGSAPVAHGRGEIPSWFLDGGDDALLTFASSVTSASMMITYMNMAPVPITGTYTIYYR